MNNSQFRKLVLESSTPRPENGAEPSPRPSATPFGAKSRGFMTPRRTSNNSSVDFRRQLLEQAADKQQRKKFRSSAAPKGTKLAAGYRDRTLDRQDEEEDDKAKRIKALEEQVKLGQIEKETFEKLRDQITGGDISSTHLVKGLDRQLLERIKRGEDVLDNSTKSKTPEEEIAEEDVDGALGKIEDESSAPTIRAKTVKKGEMAPPPAVAGAKRDRNALLAELRASRIAATESNATATSKFRKIGDPKQTSRIEIDAKGREVMIVTNSEGNVKRKVRKTRAENDDVPAKEENVLGADVTIPEQPAPSPVLDEDEDMFADAGSDYNPFGNTAGSDDDLSSDEKGDAAEAPNAKSRAGTAQVTASKERIETIHAVTADGLKTKRNYFEDDQEDDTTKPFNPLQDPAILAALRKSRDTKIKPQADPEEQARQNKRAAMLAASNRDFEDMDMGFGSSKLADEEEMEEGDNVKLSEWGNDNDEGGRSGKKQRKRGPKKKKGDKNNAADVMKVMESRKGGG